jgi:hypothetical protein
MNGKNERLWVMLTTVSICAMVVWCVDVDGRYLQQATLFAAGMIAGALIASEGDEL